MEHYVIAQEEHKDGNFHLHAWFITPKTYNFKDCRKFDLTDNDGKVYHGKYESCRSNKAVLTYCSKDSKFISDKSLEELQLIVKARKNKSTVVGEMILAEGKLTAGIIQDFPHLIA